MVFIGLLVWSIGLHWFGENGGGMEGGREGGRKGEREGWRKGRGALFILFVLSREREGRERREEGRKGAGVSGCVSEGRARTASIVKVLKPPAHFKFH